jgi:hypothetical protein
MLTICIDLHTKLDKTSGGIIIALDKILKSKKLRNL